MFFYIFLKVLYWEMFSGHLKTAQLPIKVRQKYQLFQQGNKNHTFAFSNFQLVLTTLQYTLQYANVLN